MVGVTYHPKREDESEYLQVRVAPDAAYRRHKGGHSHLGVGVWLAGGRKKKPSCFFEKTLKIVYNYLLLKTSIKLGKRSWGTEPNFVKVSKKNYQETRLNYEIHYF